VTDVGHYGTGNLEIIIDSEEDFEEAKALFTKSYEAS
jgi:predicted transport protein